MAAIVQLVLLLGLLAAAAGLVYVIARLGDDVQESVSGLRDELVTSRERPQEKHSDLLERIASLEVEFRRLDAQMTDVEKRAERRWRAAQQAERRMEERAALEALGEEDSQDPLQLHAFAPQMNGQQPQPRLMPSPKRGR